LVASDAGNAETPEGVRATRKENVGSSVGEFLKEEGTFEDA